MREESKLPRVAHLKKRQETEAERQERLDRLKAKKEKEEEEERQMKERQLESPSGRSSSSHPS